MILYELGIPVAKFYRILTTLFGAKLEIVEI